MTNTVPNSTNDAGSGILLVSRPLVDLAVNESNTFPVGSGTGGGRTMSVDVSASTCTADWADSVRLCRAGKAAARPACATVAAKSQQPRSKPRVYSLRLSKAFCNVSSMMSSSAKET
jgi:hypothetical protein